MTKNEMILTAIIGLAIPPIIVYLTRKKGKGVVVTCPGCGTDLKLSRLRNYKCPKCHEEVNFFDMKTRRLRSNTRFVNCKCGQENVHGMKYCIKCDALLIYDRKDKKEPEGDGQSEPTPEE